MKLLFDQSLAPGLVHRLASRFPDSRHVRDVDLGEASDREVWDFAAEHDYAIVSKAADFVHMALLRGFPPKVVRLEAEPASVAQVESMLSSAVEAIRAFDRDAEASLLTLPALVLHFEGADRSGRPT